MKCLKDNKDINNGDIIEMRYNPNDKNDLNGTFTYS